jgi:hypothetical protein
MMCFAGDKSTQTDVPLDRAGGEPSTSGRRESSGCAAGKVAGMQCVTARLFC